MTKPPYHVPLMTEIASIKPNGYRVISTFSGCGGSCLGYRMAGFSVLWANEFIPAARATYKANHPGSILDDRDIRKIKPGEILRAIKLDEGELDLMDGSPPCASFSSAGKREAGWSKVKPYSDTKQRTDDLFFEYARILDGLQPKVFVAENVAGLVKGTAKGYFLDILKRLKECGYQVEAKVLDAQWLGVPQARQRLIFIGVRNDLRLSPTFPVPLLYQYSVRDVLAGIAQAGFDGHGSFAPYVFTDKASATITNQPGHFYVVPETDEVTMPKLLSGKKSGRQSWNLPSPTVMTTNIDGSNDCTIGTKTNRRKLTIAELRRICAFPDDFILTGTYAQQWERLGRAVPPVMMARIAETVRDRILSEAV